MTAFVSHEWSQVRNDKKVEKINSNAYKIRFFTSNQEFGLCGHATVATTMLLSQMISRTQNNRNISNKFEFETRFGEKLVAIIDENDLITLSMPIHFTNHISSDENWFKDLVDSTLGPNLDSTAVEEVYCSKKFVLIKLKDSNENNVNKVEPNFERLAEVDRHNAHNAVIVTQKANFELENCHFYSRVFAPWIGVNEDPVCGSAHTQLTPFWREKLGINGCLIGNQCSKRGGILKCFIKGDRVELTGSAVIVIEGHLIL
jgi:PhzF family phenazine biosynthesis protein